MDVTEIYAASIAPSLEVSFASCRLVLSTASWRHMAHHHDHGSSVRDIFFWYPGNSQPLIQNRGEPDKVLKDIAEYVMNYPVGNSKEAMETARYALIDAIG